GMCVRVSDPVVTIRNDESAFVVGAVTADAAREVRDHGHGDTSGFVESVGERPVLTFTLDVDRGIHTSPAFLRFAYRPLRPRSGVSTSLRSLPFFAFPILAV